MNQPEVSFPHMLKYGLISMYDRKKRDSVLPMKSKGSIYEEHIGRNPRFDREGHWAEIGNIGQTYGTLGRY